MSQEKYIIKLEEKDKNLQAQIDNLTEMILLLNKKQFGHSSEKTPKNQVLDNQLELDSFDEAEKLYNPKVIEPSLVDLIASKKRNTKAIREHLIKQLPVTEIECVLEGEAKNCL